MADYVDRLKHLLLRRSDSTRKETSAPAARPVYRGGGIASQPKQADFLAPSGDTVPDLRLLDESQDPDECGINPYETSSDFHWKRS